LPSAFNSSIAAVFAEDAWQGITPAEDYFDWLLGFLQLKEEAPRQTRKQG
tara:strand:+ start:159 stop:308 length:150 start_codon:yes stop_codon:yes gene_type:complete